MRSLPLIGFAILGIGLIILLVSGSPGEVLGLDGDSFARLISASALLVVFGSAIVWRQNLSGVARSLGAWLVIILAIMTGYQYRYELQDAASRLTAGLVPGSPMSVTDAEGRASVVLDKRADGHFEVRASVQQATLRLLIDTGATTTVLTGADAVAAGIDVAGLSYTVPISTANGMTRAAAASAREIAIGAIVRRNLPILVAADGTLDQSLLGMNFIATLSGFDIRGDRMTLRD